VAFHARHSPAPALALAVSVLARLASALGRRDEQPNVALARDLALRRDRAAVAELARALATAPRPLQHDAIKTLYELGAIAPELLAPHLAALFEALKCRSNRVVWGALTALDTLAALEPGRVARRLPAILAAARAGSIIGRDRTVSLLVKLAQAGHARRARPALRELLATAADHQFPLYLEMAAAVPPPHDDLRALLGRRLPGVTTPARRRRLARVARRLR
jgi:hypothetical protein